MKENKPVFFPSLYDLPDFFLLLFDFYVVFCSEFSCL